MAFPGFDSAPIEAEGIVVPTPPYEDAHWFVGVSAPVPDNFVVNPDMACTFRKVTTQGGFATAAIIVDPVAWGPGIQAQITYETVWDVVLLDSFEDSLCPGINPLDPLGKHERLLFGRGDAGSIVRLNRGQLELGETVEAFLRPNVIAPAGIGGRCLFQNVYVAVEGSTGGVVELTPVVDGKRLTEEAITWVIPSDGTSRQLHRFEVPLSQKHEEAATERSRAGLVGTWFTVEMVVLDTFGCGRLEFGGIEVEYVQLQEDVTGTVYTGESLTVPLSQPVRRWFMGTAAGSVLRGAVGTDDNGTAVAVRLETNEVAPAGAGGECLWINAYVAFSRLNASDWTFTLTPIIDGVELDPVSVTLAGVMAPVTEVLEVSLSQPYVVGGVERSRYHPRGAWCKVRFSSTDAPDQDVIFEGVEIEHEVVTESVEAITDA